MSTLAWKAIGCLVLVGLLIGGLYTINGWREDSNKLPLVEKQYDDYKTAVKAANDKIVADQALDEKARGALTTKLSTIDSKIDALAKRPIQTVNHYDTTLADGTVCPAERLSGEWVVLYNQYAAVTAPQ